MIVLPVASMRSASAGTATASGPDHFDLTVANEEDAGFDGNLAGAIDDSSTRERLQTWRDLHLFGAGRTSGKHRMAPILPTMRGSRPKTRWRSDVMGSSSRAQYPAWDLCLAPV